MVAQEEKTLQVTCHREAVFLILDSRNLQNQDIIPQQS